MMPTLKTYLNDFRQSKKYNVYAQREKSERDTT
jgi:hypothetical protein